MKHPLSRSGVTLLALLLITAACGGGAATVEDIAVTTTKPGVPATTSTTEPSAPTTTESPAAVTTTTEPVDLGEVSPLFDVVGGSPTQAGWLVEPGRYSAELQTKSLEIDVLDSLSWEPNEAWMAFGRRSVTLEQYNSFWFSEFVGVIPADQVGTHPPHQPEIPENTEPLPEDLGDWLAAIPQLKVEDGGEVAGEGFAARVWDVTVDASGGPTFECWAGNCIATFVPESNGFFVMGDGFQFRILEFIGAGEGLYGLMQAHPSAYADTVALTEMLLEGLTIEISG